MAVLNLSSSVEHHARLTPTRAAVVWKDVRLSYDDLNRRIGRLANGLKGIGIEPGDHVALSCPNLPYFPIAYYALLRMGAVVVPLNVTFKPREIAYHLADSDAKALLCFEGTPELPMARMARQALQEVPGCSRFVLLPADPRAPAAGGELTLQALMADQPDEHPTYPTDPNDTAVILYTSGTTGQPKGAELTHLNEFLNSAVVLDIHRSAIDCSPSGSNVVLVTLPLFHSTGQTAQMNTGFYGGWTLVLLPRFDPAAVLETMARERVNFWVGVPTMYWALLQHATTVGVDPEPIARHLRLAASGGAPMPVVVMTAFEQTFGVRILEGYGLSETSPVAAFNHVERPSRAGTVGQPLLGVEIRCVDEHDRPVPAGTRGEIVVRGHNVMKGYYKRPDATAEAMRNGWFHTGDIGVFDDDGYLSVVDRKKDMIIRGGQNVYPRELEEVLMTHPAITQAAVVGVPDEKYGEEIKAFIVRKPEAAVTETDLLTWCKEQFASYKYPRLIEFRDSLPVSTTGKILKRELRTERVSR
jgi:long-chain acyl-CoA synthetase